MGTTCTVARLTADGMVEQIHVSYDGYLTGAGLTLFRHYATEERVAALFAHQDWAPSLEADPDDISWGEWDEERRRQDPQAFEQEHGHDTGADAEPGDLGVYLHVNGRWTAPRSAQSLRRILAGADEDAITREMLLAEGARDEDFTQAASRPVDEHRGTLRVELVPGDTQACILHLVTEGGQDHAITPGPGFTGVEGAPDIRDARDLDGVNAVVRSASMAVTASFGPQGSTSRSVIAARSIRIVPTDGATQGQG